MIKNVRAFIDTLFIQARYTFLFGVYMAVTAFLIITEPPYHLEKLPYFIKVLVAGAFIFCSVYAMLKKNIHTVSFALLVLYGINAVIHSLIVQEHYASAMLTVITYILFYKLYIEDKQLCKVFAKLNPPDKPTT